MGRYQDVELDDIEITGERLLLRRWAASDAETVAAIMRDESMFEFLGLPRPYTLDVAREFVTNHGHEGRSEGTGFGSAVVERSSGRVVASAALRHLAGHCDIGYWVAPDARGRGYAAEATRLLTAWALEHGVPRVTVLCDVRNLASIRTALAAGFHYEGTDRSYDWGPADPGTGFRERIDVARFSRLVADVGAPVPPRFPPLPPGGLTDGVLTLRVMRASDGPAMLETMDDPVSRSWDFDVPPPPEVILSLAAHSGLNALVGPNLRLAMIDAATGGFAGEVNLRLSGPPRVGLIGYAVHPGFRGRAYTTRALRLLTPWAFEVAGFGRLELGAKIDNIASQRAAAAAGFEEDGVRRRRLRNIDGTFSDEARFALINPTVA